MSDYRNDLGPYQEAIRWLIRELHTEEAIEWGVREALLNDEEMLVQVAERFYWNFTVEDN